MTRFLTRGLTMLFMLGSVSLNGQTPPMIGSWRLISYETVTSEGMKSLPLGTNIDGLAIYLPNGRVSIQFMRRDRPKFASGDAWRGTLEEERAAFEGFFGYAGRYTIDAARSTVTHHIEISAAPNYVGTAVVRTFSVEGNRLTLRTPQRQLAGQTSASTLVWERIN
jgi:hypothetical protein